MSTSLPLISRINTMILKSNPENPSRFLVGVAYAKKFIRTVSLVELKQCESWQICDYLKKKRAFNHVGNKTTLGIY